MTFRDQLQPQKMRFNGVWWYLEIIDLWDRGCDWDEAGELIVFCGRQWHGQRRPNHTWWRFCEISKLLSLKHKSLLFSFSSHLLWNQFLISMTCGCRPSTRTCSTEVSLYRLKKSRVSIDFSCAPLYSVLAVYERPGPEFNLLVAYGFGSTKTSGFGNLWRTCRSDPLQKTSLQSLQQLFVCHLQRIAVNFHPGFLFMGSSFIKGRHII